MSGRGTAERVVSKETTQEFSGAVVSVGVSQNFLRQEARFIELLCPETFKSFNGPHPHKAARGGGNTISSRPRPRDAQLGNIILAIPLT